MWEHEVMFSGSNLIKSQFALTVLGLNTSDFVCQDVSWTLMRAAFEFPVPIRPELIL